MLDVYPASDDRYRLWSHLTPREGLAQVHTLPVDVPTDITTTLAPLTHQRRKKTNCLLHFRVLNLKKISMNPAMVGSQENKMMNSR